MSASPTTGGSAASGAAGVSRAPASLARFAGFSSDYWSRQLRAALDSRGQPLVRHRRWALSGFPSCFEGRELVSWLVRSGRVDSREEGAAVGEYLRRSNVLHHVTDGHGFEDRPLFYRFRCDDPEVCQQSPLPAPGVGALAGPRRGPSASQLLSERRLCLGGWWLKQGRVLLNLRFLVLVCGCFALRDPSALLTRSLLGLDRTATTRGSTCSPTTLQRPRGTALACVAALKTAGCGPSVAVSAAQGMPLGVQAAEAPHQWPVAG